MGRLTDIVRSWRESRQQKRDLLTFAVFLGYSSVTGGLHLIDPLAQRQFWKQSSERSSLHIYPMPAQRASFMTPVQPGQSGTIDLPDNRKATLTSQISRDGVDLLERIEVSGMFNQPFVHQRRVAPDGSVQIEVRVGEKFHAVSARLPEAESGYLRALNRFAATLPAAEKPANPGFV